ncbi:MAG: hypothetical protein JNM56_39070 [Planctomycetia bacterium]|nr:hypothetical protein [Planctomycetia bacterium]
MTALWSILFGLVLLALAIALFWRPARTFGREVQVGRARELFQLQREKLEHQFQATAAESGKPRGLRWKQCRFEPFLQLARDRNNGQLIGLVAVNIQFEAVEGGDMEGLPAVDNLRYASAVFIFARGQWTTEGKTVFNMNPREALTHFQNQYEPVDGEH